MNISRRRLLGSSAAAATFALGACALNTGGAAVTQPIGLQLYTLGDTIASDLPGALRRVAEIGYKEVEIPNLYGKSGAEWRQMLDAAGLACPSVHVQVAPIAPGMLSMADMPSVIREARALGVAYVTAPIFPFSMADVRAGESVSDMMGRIARSRTADDWSRLAATLNEKAAILARENLQLAYHNHNMDFVPVGNGVALDILFAETDPALVKFEVDVGWVKAAGVDPADFINRHRNRIRLLHVKDLHDTPVNNAVILNPADVSTGIMDWTRVLAAAKAAHVQHYFVEQEPPYVHPRIEAARVAFEFLRTALPNA